ncbi:hypothetical protein Naga_101524g1 [Nannochloropsis gaditana]|uniref:Uncharacterized protein n=1 Tax=Nannochloropsis gaditana TaxID=72520 RepID=W7TAV1_9STRA|nr:hypothetical protein Naga_101524g1 [Nannochloropsis gaditana]
MGEDDLLLGRDDCIPTVLTVSNGCALNMFPIDVCVPEWEVESVILGCPKEKPNDLVFMQSACLETLLKRYGWANKKTTQCLPDFSISPFGFGLVKTLCGGVKLCQLIWRDLKILILEGQNMKFN